MFACIRRNLDLYRSDFGREYGWYVEWQGKRIAELVDPIWDSHAQFWHDYRIVPLTTLLEELAALGTQAFWHQGGLVYQNRKYGTRIPHALAGELRETSRGQEIKMRFLSIPIPWPSLWKFLNSFLPKRERRRV